MFSYVSLGTNDIARARAFYDAVMATLGHQRVADMDDGRSAAWGVDDPGPHLWVTLPFDGGPATAGNGTMVSFLAPTRTAVDAFHAAALAAGGRRHRRRRPRPAPAIRAAFLRRLRARPRRQQAQRRLLRAAVGHRRITGPENRTRPLAPARFDHICPRTPVEGYAMTYLLFLLGLVGLFFGGEWLVRGHRASRGAIMCRRW